MRNQLLEEINPWWKNKDFRFSVKRRTEYLGSFQVLSEDAKTSCVDILIGARRVGKTSIVRSILNDLLDLHTNPNDILYFTSDNILSKQKSLDEIIREFIYTTTKKKKSQKYILIDEVQDLEEWARTVKYYHDNFNTKFVLTGSSSLILHKETAKLTGRFKLFEILGLSFREYLEFTNNTPYKSVKNNNKLLEEYLYSGGYPEYVMTKDYIKLDNAIDSTLYRDLLTLYGIRNPKILSDLLDYLAEKVTTPVSALRISKDLGITDETAKFYLQYLQDIYLIYPVYKYGASHKMTKSSQPKYYFSDTGILNRRSLNRRLGLFAENAIYLHLRRKSLKKEHADIYYYNDGNEVDFYLPQEKHFLEVKYKESIFEEEILKYSNRKRLSMCVKNLEHISCKEAYPEINFENISAMLLQ